MGLVIYLRPQGSSAYLTDENISPFFNSHWLPVREETGPMSPFPNSWRHSSRPDIVPATADAVSYVMFIEGSIILQLSSQASMSYILSPPSPPVLAGPWGVI